MTIEEIAKTFPYASFTVSASDLIAFGERLVTETMEKVKEDTERNKDANDLLSDAETCQLFKVAPQTLWRWRKRGYIEGIHVGGRIMYSRKECERILNSQEIK